MPLAPNADRSADLELSGWFQRVVSDDCCRDDPDSCTWRDGPHEVNRDETHQKVLVANRGASLAESFAP